MNDFFNSILLTLIGLAIIWITNREIRKEDWDDDLNRRFSLYGLRMLGFFAFFTGAFLLFNNLL